MTLSFRAPETTLHTPTTRPSGGVWWERSAILELGTTMKTFSIL